MGGVGRTGRSRRHGQPSKSTYLYFVTFPIRRSKQRSVTFFWSNKVPDPTLSAAAVKLRLTALGADH